MLGAVAAVTTVIGPMLERRSGTILFTTRGAAINPNPARTGVGISFAGEGVYVNALDAGRPVREAYASDVYDRLVEIKRRYDPAGAFSGNGIS